MANRTYILPVTSATGSGGGGGGTPSGPAGGGLTGTYPNPTVASVPISAFPNSSAPPTTFPATNTSLISIGDSITLGYGLPQTIATAASTQAWPSLYANMLGIPLSNNYANTGAGITTNGTGNSYIGQAYALTPSNTVASAALVGANDYTFGTANAASTTMYQNAIMALVAWLAIPNSSKVLDASISYVGAGWGTLSFQGLAGHYNFSSGQTATATVSGTTVYFAGWANGTYGSYDVTIDSVSQGNFPIAPAGNSAGGTAYPYCIRISGLSAGSHTVVLTSNTNAGANAVTLNWIGGNNVATKPTFVLGNTLPQSGQSAGNTATMAGVCNNVVTALAADGLNVFLANTTALLTLGATPTQYQGNSPHPNMYGACLVARGFYEACTPAVTYPATASIGGDDLAQILNTSGLTPSELGSFIKGLANFWASPNIENSFASIDGSGNLLTTNLNKITSYGAVATVGQGLSPIQFVIAATAQAANYNAGSAKTLITPTVSGSVYRICASEFITQAASSTSTLPSITIGWTDPSSVARTKTILATSATNTTAVEQDAVLVIATDGSTAVTLTAASYASSGGTAMNYDLYVSLEKII